MKNLRKNGFARAVREGLSTPIGRAAIDLLNDLCIEEIKRRSEAAVHQHDDEGEQLFDDENVVPTDLAAPLVPRVVMDMWIQGDADDRAEVDRILAAQRMNQFRDQHEDQKRLFDWWPA
jgi:hypothetical protein